jgi:hypothetical protein
MIALYMFVLSSSQLWAKPFFNFAYGLSSYSNEKKSDLDLALKKTPLKIGIGQRYGHLEFELQYRIANGEADFKHDNIKNSLIHKNSAILAGIGIYTIPAIRLQGGIAFQTVKESLSEEVSAIQEEEISEKYGLSNNSSLGTYVGADFHLFTIWNAKFNLSGVAYFTSGLGGAKEYEATMGIKIPFGGGGRSSSFNPLRSMSDR